MHTLQSQRLAEEQRASQKKLEEQRLLVKFDIHLRGFFSMFLFQEEKSKAKAVAITTADASTSKSTVTIFNE